MLLGVWYGDRAPQVVSEDDARAQSDRGFVRTSRRGIRLSVTGNKDVAIMVARYAGASLGLFAFTVAIVAGLYVRNPVTVTLSRGIFALFLFCALGLVLGAAAQSVITEHEHKRESEILEKYRDDVVDSPEVAPPLEESESSEVFVAERADAD
jgi:hypothetical protein